MTTPNFLFTTKSQQTYSVSYTTVTQETKCVTVDEANKRIVTELLAGDGRSFDTSYKLRGCIKFNTVNNEEILLIPRNLCEIKIVKQ